MCAARYRKFMQLCERWPLDPSKGEKRDLGALLRRQVGKNFNKGELSEVTDREKCDRMYDSLNAICNDTYKNEYPSGLTVGALGFKLEEMHAYLSEKNLEDAKIEGKGFFRRHVTRFRQEREKKKTLIPTSDSA